MLTILKAFNITIGIEAKNHAVAEYFALVQMHQVEYRRVPLKSARHEEDCDISPTERHIVLHLSQTKRWTAVPEQLQRAQTEYTQALAAHRSQLR